MSAYPPVAAPTSRVTVSEIRHYGCEMGTVIWAPDTVFSVGGNRLV
jgi:hypothetical protein